MRSGISARWLPCRDGDAERPPVALPASSPASGRSCVFSRAVAPAHHGRARDRRCRADPFGVLNAACGRDALRAGPFRRNGYRPMMGHARAGTACGRQAPIFPGSRESRAVQVARGDAAPRSDIDLAVAWPRADPKRWSDIVEAAEEAPTLLHIDLNSPRYGTIGVARADRARGTYSL